MKLFARTLILAASVALPSAVTARAPNETPVMPLQAHPSQPSWTKICPTPDSPRSCYVTRDFVSADGSPVLAIGIYNVSAKGGQLVGRVLLPLGLSLPSGIRVAVDDGSPTAGQFSSCVPTGCFVEFQIDPEFARELRKGGMIRIAALNQYKGEIGFVAPLQGLAAAFDGPALTDAALARQQDNMRRHLSETKRP